MQLPSFILFIRICCLTGDYWYIDKSYNKGFRSYTNIKILHVIYIYIRKYFISDLYFDVYIERTKITFVIELKTRSLWPTYYFFV